MISAQQGSFSWDLFILATVKIIMSLLIGVLCVPYVPKACHDVPIARHDMPWRANSVPMACQWRASGVPKPFHQQVACQSRANDVPMTC